MVQEVSDEANGAAKDKEAIEAAIDNVLVCLLLGKGTTGSQQVNQRHSDGTIHVQDQVGLQVAVSQCQWPIANPPTPFPSTAPSFWL